MGGDQFGGLVGARSRNATMAWLVTLCLCALAANHALEESYRWFLFTGLAIAVVVAPAVAFGNPRVMPPWELLLVVAVPVVDATVFGESFLTAIAIYVAVAAVALIAVVEIDRFTPARMNHAFAIGLVVIATLAVAAVWNVALWVADAAVGTDYIAGDRSGDAANHALMIDFVYATVAGFLAGVVFDRYVRMRSDGGSAAGAIDPGDGTAGSGDGTVDSADGTVDSADGPSRAPPDRDQSSVPSLVRDRLDVPEPYVRLLSRAMQVALGIILLYGLAVRDVPTIANASIAFALTFLPAVLERDSRLPLEPELVFWLTAAVFLHALGSAGLYDLVGLWDSVTHTLSASIVAAGGYVIVRAIDLHTDEVYLPPKLMATFILLFALAMGVVWELMEFVLDLLAQRFGFDAVLAQHGIDDTVGDLVFDLVGAVVAAVWGSIYLTDVSHRLAERFGN